MPSELDIRSWFLPGVVFLILSVYYFWFTWHDEFSGLISDSGIYLLMADYFSPFTVQAQAVSNIVFTQYPFPPLYPILLAAAGGGTTQPTITHGVTTLMLIASCIAMYVWLRRESAGIGASVLMCVIFATLPTTLWHAQIPLSEHLYLLITLVVFGLGTGKHTEKKSIIAGLFIGFAWLTREIGVVLAVAFVVTLIIHKQPGKWRAFLVMLALPIAWKLYKVWVGSDNSYLEGLLNRLDDDPVKYFLFTAQNSIKALSAAMIKSFDHLYTDRAAVLVGILCILFVGGLLKRLVEKNLDAFYTLAYFVVIFVWSHHTHSQRFLYPLIPLLLLYGYLSLQWIYDGLAWRPAKTLLLTLYAGIIFSMSLPTLALFSQTVWNAEGTSVASFARSSYGLSETDWSKAKRNSLFIRDMYQAIRESGTLVPASDCMYSVNPPLAMMFSARAGLSAPPRPASVDLYRQVAIKCRYFLTLSVTSNPNFGYPAHYPYDQIQGWTTELRHWRTEAKRDTVVAALFEQQDFKTRKD